MRKYVFLFTFSILSACAQGNYHDYLHMYDLQPPTTANFTHCYGYGCQTRNNIPLPQATEKKLIRHFTPTPQTAEEEREKIAIAIEIFEKDIGAITGTQNDKYGTFRLYQDDAKRTLSFQQDCVDESTNTTIYLGLLEQMGFMKFHRPVFPASRQPFISGRGWWHQTAVMQDIKTGERYAVDSWFRDNGHPAFIVPLAEWKDGWRPSVPLL